LKLKKIREETQQPELTIFAGHTYIRMYVIIFNKSKTTK